MLFAHDNFKKAIKEAKPGDTLLTMKELVPVRLLKNKFFQDILRAEQSGADKDALTKILGKGRAKKGMLEGDMIEGELEIGQVSALIKNTPTVSECVQELVKTYCETLNKL